MDTKITSVQALSRCKAPKRWESASIGEKSPSHSLAKWQRAGTQDMIYLRCLMKYSAPRRAYRPLQRIGTTNGGSGLGRRSARADRIRRAKPTRSHHVRFGQGLYLPVAPVPSSANRQERVTTIAGHDVQRIVPDQEEPQAPHLWGKLNTFPGRFFGICVRGPRNGDVVGLKFISKVCKGGRRMPRFSCSSRLTFPLDSLDSKSGNPNVTEGR